MRQRAFCHRLSLCFLGVEATGAALGGGATGPVFVFLLREVAFALWRRGHRPSLCLKVGCRRQSCRLSVFMHTQALEPQAQPSFFCSLAPEPQAQPLCSPRQSCRGSAQLGTRPFGGLRRSHDSGCPRPVEGCRLWAKPAETNATTCCITRQRKILLAM